MSLWSSMISIMDSKIIAAVLVGKNTVMLAGEMKMYTSYGIATTANEFTALNAVVINVVRNAVVIIAQDALP